MDKKLNNTQQGANMTNPTENIIIDEDNFLNISEEMAEELAYDAAVFETAMRDMQADSDYEPSIEREGMYR